MFAVIERIGSSDNFILRLTPDGAGEGATLKEFASHVKSGGIPDDNRNYRISCEGFGYMEKEVKFLLLGPTSARTRD